jgi:uncharacterized protein (TIGR02588 family)
MRRNWLEWLILVASVAAILGIAGFLLVSASQSREPANLRVEPRSAEASEVESGWQVPVTVRNAGGEAAARVVVEARGTVDGSDVASTITLELLPPHSTVDAWIAFGGPPDGPVSFRIVGWEAP